MYRKTLSAVTRILRYSALDKYMHRPCMYRFAFWQHHFSGKKQHFYIFVALSRRFCYNVHVSVRHSSVLLCQNFIPAFVFISETIRVISVSQTFCRHIYTGKKAMAEGITQIYDKLFKKILTLFNVALTNLINGLFGTDYPPDSKITYNGTESENKELNPLSCRHDYHRRLQSQPPHGIAPETRQPHCHKSL